MNREPRPIVSALIFVLGALLIGAGLFWTSETVAPTYPAIKLRMRLFEQKVDSIDIINVGHSHNRAIDYRAMGVRGFHLWDGGSDLLESAYLLRVVAPMLPNLKAVLIPLLPLSFRIDNSLFENRRGLRRQYYATTPSLASWFPIRGDTANLLRGKLSPIVRDDHWRAVFGVDDSAGGGGRSQLGDQRGGQGVFDDDGSPPPVATRMNPAMSTERILYVERLIEYSEASVRAKPQLPDDIYRELAAVIATLRARDVRVICFSSPYLESVNQLYAGLTTEQNELKHYVGRLSEEHGVEYFDFATDPAFTNRPDWFFNEDHLNLFGAKAFSRKLSDLLGLPQYRHQTK